MIREGEPDVTLAYLSNSPKQYLSVDEYAEGEHRCCLMPMSSLRRRVSADCITVQTQGRNIKHYSTYLMYRAKSYQKAKTDYVRTGRGRMKQLTVDKGLLRETEAVQEQIAALVKCDVSASSRLLGLAETNVISLLLRNQKTTSHYAPCVS